MNLLFDDAGKFQAGRILSEAEASAQVEINSGKRVKVKSAQQLLRFDAPAPDALLAQAQALAAQIELPLAWEFAPEDEFGFADLAADYFGGTPTAPQQAAALLALHGAPHYFRRAGKGRYKKAPAETVAQALAAIEKKKQIAEQVAAWAEALTQGRTPAPVAAQLYRILFKPDKNAPEYKAVVEAARASNQPPLALLRQAGAIGSAYEFHWQRFLFEHFPRGTAFPADVQTPPAPADLPLAPVQAFSIDDSHTTEIDDALSLQGLGSGAVTLGIHIAAPGLALMPGDALDALARVRLSTVYMPGCKITMLPDAVVQAYTLAQGCAVPAVSLYLALDEATLEVKSSRTRLERVPICANLRHDQLDAIVTPAWLASRDFAHENATQPLLDLGPQLSFLHRLAQHLKAKREQARGKPETFNRPDYSFSLLPAGALPSGQEEVQITERQRGAPLDLIVAEAMILANSTWGQWLASLGVPAIYRSQASLAPGIKVRMGTRALPHAGIGVPSYAWSTSPLRRYVDLVNQWQIIAAARHGQAAALAAPFKPKDAQLLSILSSFEAAYTAYNQHQAAMERYWTLQYLRQHGITELEATLLKEQSSGVWLARAQTLPLVFSALGAAGLARGTRVRARLGEVDDIALDVRGAITQVLQADADAIDAESEDESENTGSGPLAIAVDVSAEPPEDAGP